MEESPIFEGLKVVELASVLAGPSVGQFFAELGADVIKVENPMQKGDVTRSWKLKDEQAEDGLSAYFCAANWGKRSMALDLKSSKDHAVLLRLIARADLLISSFRPGAATKLGLDYSQLCSDNPRLVYAEIRGYSNHDGVGYDAVIQAESGFMSMNGSPDGESLKMPVALVDILAAHHLKESILLALLRRSTTGKGCRVSVALMDAAIASLANQGTGYLMYGNVPQKQGSLHPTIAPYGESFACSDGKIIMLAIGNNGQFIRLCALFNVPEIASHYDYANNEQRVKHRVVLGRLFSPLFKQKKSDVLIDAFQHLQIPAGLVSTLPEAIDSHVLNNLVLSSPTFPHIKGLKQLISLSDGLQATRNLLSPPTLDQHHQEILNDWLL